MRVLLIRHAESSGQEPGVALTGRGLAQARALAAALSDEPIGKMVSSPFLRARQTAGPLAAHTKLHIDARLAEWQLPRLPDAEWPHGLRPILTGSVPLPAGVESVHAARARGLAALREAAARADGVPALVTHGKLLALVLGALQGIDPFDIFVTLRNPHVFDVQMTGSTSAVRSRA
ncbi:MAG TPA: histidine phosphatase family protein [Candidatus Binatia bacterium]|nr:histidine phosphatase family protein [Candidatus Binatia bacterium]